MQCPCVLTHHVLNVSMFSVSLSYPHPPQSLPFVPYTHLSSSPINPIPFSLSPPSHVLYVFQDVRTLYLCTVHVQYIILNQGRQNYIITFQKQEFTSTHYHISNICHASSFGLHKIGHIRKYLDQSTTERLIHAFVMSQIYNCNSVLYGLP